MRKLGLIVLLLMVSITIGAVQAEKGWAIPRPTSSNTPTSTVSSGEQSPMAKALAVITILVEFPDLRHSRPRDQLHASVFTEMNNYFREVSYNKISIQGDTVDDWIMMPRTYAEYKLSGLERDAGIWSRRRNFAEEVIRIADNIVDFKKYEYVMIFIPYSWPSTKDFVSYALWGRQIPTRDGVMVTRIAVMAESHHLGIICHEFAHLLGGLPDLYDYSLASKGQDAGIYVGQWDLMSYIPRMRITPHLMAFNKIKLGWIGSDKIKTVSARRSTLSEIQPIEVIGDGIYAVKIPLADRMYYLVEVRKRIGYDGNLPDEGVLISLIDERKESGHGIVRVQDANPKTATLDDATLDIRPGKQTAFFDTGNDIAIVVTGKSAQGYTIFTGTVSKGMAIQNNPEKKLFATFVIDEAKMAIEKAEAEGRTEGLDEAKTLIARSKQKLEEGSYDEAIALANEAIEKAENAKLAALTTKSVSTLQTATQVGMSTPITSDSAIILAVIIAGIIMGIILVKKRKQ